MLVAGKVGHQSLQPVMQAIIELAEHAAKEPGALPEASAEAHALQARIDTSARTGLAAAYREPDKQARHDRVGAAKKQALEALAAEVLDIEKAKSLFEDLEADIVRNAILDTG